jgi:hypothetical protein
VDRANNSVLQIAKHALVQLSAQYAIQDILYQQLELAQFLVRLIAVNVTVWEIAIHVAMDTM